MDNCILCGRALPPDNRPWLVRKIWQRFPRCTPPTVECYRGLNERLGCDPPTEQQARAAVEKARRDGGW